MCYRSAKADGVSSRRSDPKREGVSERRDVWTGLKTPARARVEHCDPRIDGRWRRDQRGRSCRRRADHVSTTARRRAMRQSNIRAMTAAVRLRLGAALVVMARSVNLGEIGVACHLELGSAASLQTEEGTLWQRSEKHRHELQRNDCDSKCARDTEESHDVATVWGRWGGVKERRCVGRQSSSSDL